MNAQVETGIVRDPQSGIILSIQNGVYHDITNEEYHSGPAVSKSQLDDIAISPAVYQWKKSAPVDEEKLTALDMGTALHCLLLEPEEFDRRFIVAPQFNRRTAAGNSSRWCREPLQRLDRCILQKGTRPAVRACTGPVLCGIARGAQRSFRYAYGRAAAAAVCCADPVRQYWRIAGHGDPGEKAPQLNK